MPAHDDDVMRALRGSSGLKDDFDGIIKSVAFGYDSQYQDGSVMLAIANVVPADGEDIGSQLWSTGSGWEPSDKGRRAVREDTGEPNPNGFNKQSAYQLVILELLDIPEAAEILMERAAAGTMPWDAAFLEGLNCHWNRKTFKIMGEDRERLVPSALLGVEGNAKTATKAAAKATTTAKAAPKAAGATGGKVPSASERAAAAKARAAAKAAPAEAAEDVDPVLAQIASIAAESEDFDTFMEQCYAQLDNPDDYEAIVTDDSPDGVFAQAHAE